MTDPERLQCELTHPLGLCRPPTTLNWRPYCRAKAEALAAKEPAVFADLPRLLEAGLAGMKGQSPPPTACSAQSAPK